MSLHLSFPETGPAFDMLSEKSPEQHPRPVPDHVNRQNTDAAVQADVFQPDTLFLPQPNGKGPLPFPWHRIPPFTYLDASIRRLYNTSSNIPQFALDLQSHSVFVAERVFKFAELLL
jgi:hypothetical protein